MKLLPESNAEYQHDILKLLYITLEKRKICFDIIDPNDTKNSREVDENKLLVVWSADFLDDQDSNDRCLENYQNCLNELSARQAPVLWLTGEKKADLDFDQGAQKIQFCHFGGGMLLEMNQYPLIKPQREKNFESPHHWISLSNAARPSRVLSACCLLGYNLGDLTSSSNHGLLRISNYPIVPFDCWQDYFASKRSDPISVTPMQNEILQAGFEKLKNLVHGGQPAGDPYRDLNGIQNAVNFDSSLRFLYENSLVEIVNETTFFNKSVFVTEKFLNSVYGFNLPVLICNAGTVEYLRSNGFYMFDDVIDHAYDRIADPLQRIFAAISSNIRLLTDREYARQSWLHCLPLMEKNYQYAKHDMYDHFKKQFQIKLDQFVDSIC